MQAARPTTPAASLDPTTVNWCPSRCMPAAVATVPVGVHRWPSLAANEGPGGHPPAGQMRMTSQQLT